MVGAKSGGAHGNPRVTTWYRRDDGVFTDVVAAFELYGGPLAVTVGRIAGGPDGWLIAGARTSGAAVWLSDDATDFRLVDGDPALSSDDSMRNPGLGPGVRRPAGGPWSGAPRCKDGSPGTDGLDLARR